MAESSAIPLTGKVPLRLVPRSDARLARLAAAGDERAFAAIYDRYHQEIYRYCRAILGSHHEAQDALQSTMANALRALPGEQREIKLRPWLYRVARNESISLLRRRQPVAESVEDSLPHQLSADAEFESRERLRTLVADLSSLPERQRSALVMRELSGLSHEEIAGVLGISPAGARQVVYETRVALQELEEGRAMECEVVRKALSDGDRRVLRGRRLRAHLRGCRGCADFQAAIETRPGDLGLLAPPLPAVAASGILAALAGGGTAGVGGGTLAAGGLGAGAFGAKTLGIVVASAAIGIGAGTAADVELPVLGSNDPAPPPAAETLPDAASPTHAPGTEARAAPEAPGRSADANRGASSAHNDSAKAPGDVPGNGNAFGRDGEPGPPAHSQGSPAAPAEPSGAGNGNAYGQGQAQSQGQGHAYGQDKEAGAPIAPPGQSETKIAGPPEHANAGGSSAAQEKPEK
jgi:RNA polymerase sigma factor (sigma-70 family)